MHVAVESQVFSILDFSNVVETCESKSLCGCNMALFCSAVNAVCSFVIEITLWHQWVDTSLSPQVTHDIPTVFDEQGIGFIFWMALEKDKEALVLLNECIDARTRRSCENAISGSSQYVFRYAVPSRVRKSEG